MVRDEHSQWIKTNIRKCKEHIKLGPNGAAKGAIIIFQTLCLHSLKQRQFNDKVPEPNIGRHT